VAAGRAPRPFAGARRDGGAARRDRLDLPLVYEIRAFWEDAAVGNGTGREGSLKYRATRALETRAVCKADAVAVICEGLKDDLVARGIDPGKIIVSPNGVDLNVFGEPLPARCRAGRAAGVTGAETIGFIGSFYDYEGLDVLIDAMPALVAARPSMHLVLVGGGRWKPHCGRRPRPRRWRSGSASSGACRTTRSSAITA
jgi:glycogen(starch) synthase